MDVTLLVLVSTVDVPDGLQGVNGKNAIDHLEKKNNDIVPHTLSVSSLSRSQILIYIT